MRNLWRFIALTAVAVVSIALPACAEVDLATVESCILERIETGEEPAACIEMAHSECLAAPDATPAVATLCFVEAKGVWSAGIADLLKKVPAEAPDEIAAIARIEAKYDILSGLVQCDRMEELALAASNHPGEVIARQKAHCAATASGVAYARLQWRIQALQ